VLTRFSDWTARALLVVAATLAFLLSFLVVADVVGRVAFNAPVKGTPEIVSMAIVVICFLQAGYAIRSGGMLRVTALTNVLPPRARAAFAVFGCLLGALFFAVIVYGGIEPLLHAWRSGEYEGEGALRVPAWPARLTVLVGSALALLAYLLAAVAYLKQALGLAQTGGTADPMNTDSSRLPGI
jgi:TRAP-type C4-dicarboxylate transport system permease small subunit